MSNTSKTDWARIDAMTSDIPHLTDDFLENATFRMPSTSSRATVAVPIDTDTLAWFQEKGEAAEQHMAAALKIYAEAQKNAVSLSKSA